MDHYSCASYSRTPCTLFSCDAMTSTIVRGRLWQAAMDADLKQSEPLTSDNSVSLPSQARLFLSLNVSQRLCVHGLCGRWWKEETSAFPEYWLLARYVQQRECCQFKLWVCMLVRDISLLSHITSLNNVWLTETNAHKTWLFLICPWGGSHTIDSPLKPN